MSDSIQENAASILAALAAVPRAGSGQADIDGATLAKATKLEPPEINDAVSVLVDSGYAEWRQYLGTAPFRFGQASITPRGRYELERVSTEESPPTGGQQPLNTSIAPSTTPSGALQQALAQVISKPPVPVGSPYGFDDHDWEVLAGRKAEHKKLFVVLGYQFNSDHYDSALLSDNLRSAFRVTVDRYNALPNAPQIELDFSPLAAGYGEHLFNEIARDVIGADIALFETSDLNPNVMIEMGVALTWGVRVLPIKVEGRPKPPSDISGQTWADYRNSAADFVDPDHSDRLFRMVERAARKKARQ